MARLWNARLLTHGGRSSLGARHPFRRAAAAVIATTALSSLLGMTTPRVAHAASLPWVNVGDVTAARPATGTTTFAFTISIAHPVNDAVWVSSSAANGSARSTFAYQPTSGTVSFAPGKTTATANVLVNGS